MIYANYLLAVIYFEQISDEKDLQTLLDANKQIDFFLETYPQSIMRLIFLLKKINY